MKKDNSREPSRLGTNNREDETREELIEWMRERQTKADKDRQEPIPINKGEPYVFKIRRTFFIFEEILYIFIGIVTFIGAIGFLVGERNAITAVMFICFIVIFLYRTFNYIGSKVVLDKSTRTVCVEKRYLGLIQVKQNMPFTMVEAVWIDREISEYLTYSYCWKVSIQVGLRKILVDRSGNKQKLKILATIVSTYLDVDLIDSEEGQTEDIN